MASCQAVLVLKFRMPKEKQTAGKGLLALPLVYNGVRIGQECHLLAVQT